MLGKLDPNVRKTWARKIENSPLRLHSPLAPTIKRHISAFCSVLAAGALRPSPCTPSALPLPRRIHPPSSRHLHQRAVVGCQATTRSWATAAGSRAPAAAPLSSSTCTATVALLGMLRWWDALPRVSVLLLRRCLKNYAWPFWLNYYFAE
jgi:hypothetical protein